MSLLTKMEIKEQMDYCIAQIDKGLKKYRYGFFPATGKYNKYRALYNGGWTGAIP